MYKSQSKPYALLLERPLYCERLLTEEEFADALGISLPTAVLWIKQRRIPVYRFGWKAIRIRLSDAEAFIKRHFVPAREVPIPVRTRRKQNDPLCNGKGKQPDTQGAQEFQHA